MTTENTLIEFLANKAAEAWLEERPYLLSFAAPDMKEHDIDYRAILGIEKLKAFAERTVDREQYQVVQHPNQRAKVGLVPFGVDFKFSDDDMADSRFTARLPGRQRNVLLAFLHELGKLTPEDIEGVIIPVGVLVKLANKQ